MYKRIGFLVLFLAFLVTSCSEDREVPPVAPTLQNDLATGIDVEALARAIVAQAGWPVEGGEIQGGAKVQPQCGHELDLEFLGREIISGDIAHYVWHVRVGPGEYDEIGLHRVVRETRPWRPIRTHKNVFLQHGASKDFTGMFLPGLYSSHMPRDFGAAFYFADAGVDVWGIDQSWNMVPEEETDFGFMIDWGIPRCVRDLGIGISLARECRLLSGCGHRKMQLLGYSFGAQLGYAFLDGETQRPPGHRDVEAFIPVDMPIKTDVEEFRQFWCGYGDYAEDRYYNQHIYNDDSIMRTAGKLARDYPDEDSPIVPGLTNYTVALLLGAAVGFPPTVHYVAGVWEGEIPVGLQYVSEDAWIDFLCTASPHESTLGGVDQCRQICDDAVPWDDHLGQVTVPVFYVGAKGGLGDLGLYTLTFLGSSDVTSLVVSTHPPEEILIDFAHIDLFIAHNAPELVWAPILQWVLDHSNGQGLQVDSDAEVAEQG